MNKRLLLFFTCLTVAIQCFISNIQAELPSIFPNPSSRRLSKLNKGKVVKHRFSSQILKNRRDIWIYTPVNYNKQGPSYPLLVIFDGQAYVSSLIPVPQILDRLILQQQIPKVVAIFISSIDQPSRNLELPCYQPFAEFLTQEILPWAKKNYNITSEPHRTIVAGSSYGGLAATYIALKHPETFGNVLSQSGAFWWKPSESTQEGWMMKQFEASPFLSLRFYLDAGKQEVESGPNHSSILSVNRKLRDILQQKGYFVDYYEFDGGHEYKHWAKTFPNGIISLLNSDKQEDIQMKQ